MQAGWAIALPPAVSRPAALAAAAVMASTVEDLLADWQQQVDEVQALEAIFGDDFRLLAADGLAAIGQGAADAPACQALDAAVLASAEPPPCCEASSSGAAGWALDCSLLVRVHLRSGSWRLQLSGRESGSCCSDPGGCSDGNQPCSSKQDSAGSYSVQHLSPICMQLRLAPGYPSQQQPEVSLSGLWLSASQAAELEAQLAELWHEQGPGLPVCYSWADWLQSSALQHLGASEVLPLAGQASGQLAEEDQATSSSAADSDGGAAAGDAEEEGPEDRLLKLLR